VPGGTTARTLAPSKEAFDTPLSPPPLSDEPGPATGLSGDYPDGTCTRRSGPVFRTQHDTRVGERGTGPEQGSRCSSVSSAHRTSPGWRRVWRLVVRPMAATANRELWRVKAQRLLEVRLHASDEIRTRPQFSLVGEVCVERHAAQCVEGQVQERFEFGSGAFEQLPTEE
jgi:hypothetical protein